MKPKSRAPQQDDLPRLGLTDMIDMRLELVEADRPPWLAGARHGAKYKLGHWALMTFRRIKIRKVDGWEPLSQPTELIAQPDQTKFNML